MTSRIQIVCSHCGSNDVRRDAWASWNLEKQEWELGEVFDAGHCNVCDGEARLEEVEIADPIEVLTEFADQAQTVIDSWEKGDLAGAVRGLEEHLATVREQIALHTTGQEKQPE
jgi:hypothetical protein